MENSLGDPGAADIHQHMVPPPAADEAAGEASAEAGRPMPSTPEALLKAREEAGRGAAASSSGRRLLRVAMRRPLPVAVRVSAWPIGLHDETCCWRVDRHPVISP